MGVVGGIRQPPGQIVTFGCFPQNAWDDDIVTDTIWHPGNTGKDAFTTIYLSKRIIITKVTVEQYKVRLVLLRLAPGYSTVMICCISGTQDMPAKCHSLSMGTRSI